VTEQGWIAVLQLLAYSALGFSLPSDLFAFALSLPHSRCGARLLIPHPSTLYGDT